jgi:ribosomal protein L7Ae-like RNA K-turn-binding protein
LDPATERRVLGLLGLGIRARNVVVGVEQVRMAARRGDLALAIVAPDASPNSRKKLVPLPCSAI